MINWRIYAIGGCLLGLWALSFYIVSLQTDKAKAEKEADIAKAGNTVSGATAAAVDRVIITERTVTQEVLNVVREIDALPSGDALVPDDVASAWAAGIDGVRNSTTTGPTSKDTTKP